MQMIMYRPLHKGVRINGVFIFASFQLQTNQILQLQCINPALIRVANTHIFIHQVPNTPLRNAVEIPEILDGKDACGGVKCVSRQSSSHQTLTGAHSSH